MVSTSGTYPSNLPNTTYDLCAQKYEDYIIPNTALYCNWTFDSILCWPPTPPGTTARLNCPIGLQGIDSSKFAERRCTAGGRWEGKTISATVQSNISVGWTNYTPCYTPEMLQLVKKLYAWGNEDEANIKFVIAARTRTLEIIGLSISLFALLVSLMIFCHFRSLRNNRTRIHKNLFIAMIIQVIIRLTLYLDQAIIRNGQEIGFNKSRFGIDNTPYLCEGSYVLLEYARTAMFMWMFIEGLYLHNVVTVTVFQGRFPHTLYALLGWGTPIMMTTIWAIFTAHYKLGQCWWGYNLIPYYWILEGPRLAVILLNFLFLLNIIRVLIVKLRQSHTSDVEQVRKAVRAAVVLVPLLGITNLLNMIEAPLDRTAWEFALWSYSTHFLTSFQGFFIAMLYCFLNGEVRTAIMKSISVYMSLRGHTNWLPRHHSMYSAAYVTAPDTEAAQCNDTQNRTETTQSLYQNWITSCFHKQKKLTKVHQVQQDVSPETRV